MTQISIEATNVTESSSNYVEFTVSLSDPLLTVATVNYRTLLGGTAGESDLWNETTDGVNNGTIVFSPGELTQTVRVQTNNDSIDEVDEHIVLELYDPVGADFDGPPVLRSSGFILDDDGLGSNLSLVVSDPVMVEGDTGTLQAIFNIDLSRPATTPFTATYNTIDGSARAGSDYTAASGTVSFAVGQRQATVAVDILGDTVAEGVETFSVAVTPPSGIDVDTTGAVGEATVLDTDGSALPEISISNAEAVVESSAHYLRFVITLSEPSVNAVAVEVRTLLAGTAGEGDLWDETTDSVNNPVVTFAPGETSKDFFVRTNDDTINEADEHITVELSNPVAAVLAGNEPLLRASGVILDDDGVGGNLALSVSDPVLVEGDSGQKNAVFEVRLSRPAPEAFAVGYATADGSATAGGDYASVSGTLNFVAGQEMAYVLVPIFGDAIGELDEYFSLSVAPPTTPVINMIGATGEATILDGDSGAEPVISIADAEAVVESSAHFLRYTVTLDRPWIDVVSVNYRTLIAGTAQQDDLWNETTDAENNGTVTFAPGEVSKSIFVRTNDDSIDEADEHITVELFAANGGVFAGNTPVTRANGVILDNDGVGPNLSLFVSDPVIEEGDAGQRFAVFDLRLSQPAPGDFSVSYTTVDGTAVAGADYSSVSGTATFATGQEYVSVAVPVIADAINEDVEFFSLAVTPPPSPVINVLGAVGEATIIDNDATLPQISVEGDAVTESSAHFLRFVVTLSDPASVPVTVDYQSLAASAENADFWYDLTDSRNNGTLTFDPGTTTQSVFIQLASDTIDERDEAMTLRLSNPTNAQFGGGKTSVSATGFVLDNDGVGPNIMLAAPEQDIVESSFGSTLQQVMVELSQPSLGALSFDVATIDGTAQANSDFILRDSTVTFAAGQTKAAVNIEVLGDTNATEGMETFELAFAPSQGVPFVGTIRTAPINIIDGPGLPTSLPASRIDQDLSGDGTEDILWVNSVSNQVGFYRMEGGGSFSWQDLGFAGTNYSAENTGDFNADNFDDILWQNSSTQQVGYYKMGLNGAFSWQSLGVAGAGYEIAGTGDFNADGTDDILWYNTGTQQVGYYRMADTTFTWQSLGLAGPNYVIAGTDDFNADGTDDILWFNTASRKVGFYEMDNDTFVWRDLGFAGANYEVAGTGDFDGNGADDILWLNSATQQVGYYAMESDGSFGWQSLGFAGAAYEVADVGNYDGDGTDDILWYNAATRQVGYYDVDGGAFLWQGLGIAGANYDIAAEEAL